MRLLLLGDHPDGLAFTLALLARGGHELTAFAGSGATAEHLGQAGYSPAQVKEVEAALALRDVEAVVVADDLLHRPNLIRRAMQSEKQVFCVHPADLDPNIAYEALAIQQDTHKAILPLMVDRLTPALQWIDEQRRVKAWADLGLLKHLEWEVGFPVPLDRAAELPQVPLPAAKKRAWQKQAERVWEHHPLLSLWEGLRLTGGEVEELTAIMGHGEELSPQERINITGRLRNDAFFQVLLLPLPADQPPSFRCLWRGEAGEWELRAPQGWLASSTWEYRRPDQPAVSGTLPAGDRETLWQNWVEAFERQRPLPTWTDATRCLELFDAVRRSVRRRRMIVLDYEAASELSNFKSTMTALGCGVLILCMVLFFATPTFPWLKYLIFPILILYMALQLFRYLARDNEADPSPPDPGSAAPPPAAQSAAASSPAASSPAAPSPAAPAEANEPQR